MKKKLFYITGVCALLALQTACSPQFEDLFDKSASERLEEAMDDAESVLTAADKGWAMGYFPNTETRGYVLFAKFNTDGTVTLTDYNNGGLSSTSTYSMNTSQGPVLNFDTYSEVLGHYTDPGTWLGGSTGNAGDFEFVIFNVTEDEVILKGKKYHAKIVLRKITGDGVQETLWRTYYDQCEAMYSHLFTTAISPLLKAGDVSYYTLTNPMSRVFGMYPYGSTNPEEMVSVSYVASPYGIDLAEDLTVGDHAVRMFVYDETEKVLKSQESSDVQIVGIPDLNEYFLETTAVYLAGNTALRGGFGTVFATVAAELENVYDGRQELQSVGFTAEGGLFSFVLRTGRTEGRFVIPAKVENGQFVIETFDANNFSADNMDDNAKLFYGRISSIKEMLAVLPGAYNLTNTSDMAINTLDMQSTSSENGLVLTQER